MSKLGDRKNELHAAWQQLVQGKSVDRNIIRPIIADSWERSREMGVDPRGKLRAVCEPAEFTKRLKKRQKFVDIATPVMSMLLNFVEGSGFAVILADEDGYVLETLGEQDVINTAHQGNLEKGANWSEEVGGTNAIGTCLTVGQPLQIFAAEHYWFGAHEWTCSAAPIHNPDGEIIGVLNMTGTYEKVHPHTLGMVVAAVNAIENHLQIIGTMEKLAISDQYKNTIIESMEEGILTVDHDGLITQINAQARRILELPNEAFIGRKVSDIIGLNHPLTEVLFKRQNRDDEEIYWETSNGKVHCTVTCHTIKTEGKQVGLVTILREFKAIRQLVHKMVGAEAKFNFNSLIGKSASFMNSIENAKVAANSMSNVLLLGESGTGKELFAQAIHNASSRWKGPFVAVNCAALPRELVGSELFGYTEGAFTGAKRGGSPGKFELAYGGTLFLDEIGEMPLEMQTYLLRALQEKQLIRIGGQKVIHIDVRVIAATNKNLWDEIGIGRFRSDLFFRLNVFTINIVPLRERREDIPVLVNFFMEKIAKSLGKQVEAIDPHVMDCLMDYSWPGNVRELENVLERAINLSKGRTISSDSLPEYLITKPQSPVKDMGILKSSEREVILKFLEMYDGNLSMVAKKLGISRPTLYRKLEIYQIAQPKKLKNLSLRGADS